MLKWRTRIVYNFRYKQDPKVVFATKADLEEWGSAKPSGWYCSENGLIYLIKDLTVWEREIIYLHERVHRHCHKSKCFCWGQRTDTWCEYHAYKGEFISVQEINHPCLWDAWVQQWRNMLKLRYLDSKEWRHHRKALRKLCQRKDVILALQISGLLTQIWHMLEIHP